MAVIYDPISGRYIEDPDANGFTPAAGPSPINATPAQYPGPLWGGLGNMTIPADYGMKPPTPGAGGPGPGPLGQGGAGPMAPTPGQMGPAPGEALGPQKPTFLQNHPRLAGVLSNLGPILSSLEPQQGGLTPYPVSPLSGALNALASGGRSYMRAYDAGKQQAVQRSPRVQAAQQKILSGNFENLTPEDMYLGELGGLKPPTSFMSGAQQRQGQMVGAGLAPTAEGEAGRAVTREHAAMQQRQFEEELGFKKEAFGKEFGLKEQQYQQMIEEGMRQRFQLEEGVLDNYAAEDPAQRAALRKYVRYRSGAAKEAPTPADMALVDSIQNTKQLMADIERSKTEAREGMFVRFAQAAIAARFPDGNVPPEANYLLLQVTRPGFGQSVVANEATALKTLADLDKMFPGSAGGEGLGAKLKKAVTKFWGYVTTPQDRTGSTAAPVEQRPTGARMGGVGPEVNGPAVSRARFREAAGRDMTAEDEAAYRQQNPNVRFVD